MLQYDNPYQALLSLAVAMMMAAIYHNLHCKMCVYNIVIYV